MGRGGRSLAAGGRLSLVALLATACGGVEAPAPPTRKGTSDFADVERCLYSITSTWGDLDLFASTCGGRRGSTPWARLEAGANWLATRREDASRVGNAALVTWIDFVTRRADFRLPEELPGVELPTSAAMQHRSEAFLTLVTVDKVEHQPATYASLRLTSSPPIERQTVPGARGLLVADRSLSAARLLDVAVGASSNHVAFVAVRAPDGTIARHRVLLAAAATVRPGKAYQLDLESDATVTDLVVALDDAAAKGFSAATWWRF